MNENHDSTLQDSEPDTAPDLSTGDWPEKFAKVPVRRGQPRASAAKASGLAPDKVLKGSPDGRAELRRGQVVAGA